MASLLLVQCTDKKQLPEMKDWSSVYRSGTGEPVSIALTIYKTTLIADGHDRVTARVAVTDSTGKEIKGAETPFRIYVTGDATIEGEAVTENSDDTDGKHWEACLTDGLCHFTLMAGTSPDRIKLEVKADSLWPSSHEIHTVPAGFEMRKPSRSRLKTSAIKIDRMLGADISWLPQNEKRGTKYYIGEEETDAVKALAGNGFNYVRLRLFVNPENEKGYSPGEGFCGLEQTKQMALRVKEAGMKILLNFHYSDYWADPQQQNKPLAWKDLSYEELRKTVYTYTKDVLLELKAQGTLPDMVQVGNEINHGILWPDGHISNPDQLAGLLIAGSDAVKEVNPGIPVMMHLALGGQYEEAAFWLDNMIARGVKFDLTGLSYYPRWHGTLDDLQNSLFRLAREYRKPLNVVEYALYPEELSDMIFSLPDDLGKGTCTWEPLWTMFGRDGKATDNLFLYNKISGRHYR